MDDSTGYVSGKNVKGSASASGRDIRIFLDNIRREVKARAEANGEVLSEKELNERIAAEAVRVTYHEFGHIMEVYAKEAFADFKALAVARYKKQHGEEGFNRAWSELNRNEGRELERGEVESELACDMIPELLEDKAFISLFGKQMRRDRKAFGRFLNAVGELLSRVRNFFESLGFTKRTDDEVALRSLYIFLRKSFNRASAEYRRQERQGVVAGTVIIDKKTGEVLRRNEERKDNNLSKKATIDDSVFDGKEGRKIWRSLNSRQQQSVTFAKAFAQGAGINLKITYNGKVNGKEYNGYYNRNTNTIVIDARAGFDAKYAKDAVIPTISHELTHWMKQKSPELYEKLSDNIFDVLKEATGKSEYDRIADEQARHPEYTDDEARDEIIARSCEDLLSLSETGREIFSSLSESEQKTIRAKIKEIINNVIDWANKLLSMYKSNSDEANILRAYEAELQKISKIWDEMLVKSIDVNAALEAEKTTGETRAKAEKNTAETDGVKFSFKDKSNGESKAIIEIIKNNLEKISSKNKFSVHSDTISNSIRKSDYVYGIFKEQGEIAHNSVIGNVELSYSGAKSTVFHGFGESKLAATKAIKTVIENGDIIGFTENYENSGINRYVVSSKGKINGKESYIGVVIKAYPKNKKSNAKFYLHEAIIIETDSPILTAPQLSVDAVSESASENSILNSHEKSNEEIVNIDDVQFSEKVTDNNVIDYLENQEHITTYKAMQLIYGKLYPPMAAKVKGADGKYHLTNPSEIGAWQQAVEDPSNISFNDKGVGYYTLNKGNGKSIKAAYNPYEHSSNLVLNDQFEEAYQRDNIVTVECVIPKSEMTSGYKAQYAKDSTGVLDWKSGVVAGKIKDNKRKVYLSRWLKPVRILSDAETASMYKDALGNSGVPVPFNVVTPSLLLELEKIGVPIDYEGSPQYKSIQERKVDKSGIQFSDKSGEIKKADQLSEIDFRYLLENVQYGVLEDSSYIPMRISTPEFFRDVVHEHSKGKIAVMDVPLASKVEHLRQNMEEDDGTSYGESRPHNLSVDDIVTISEEMGHPAYIVLQQNGRYAMVVSFYNSRKKKVVVSIDFASDKEPANNYKYRQYMNGYNEGYYNIIVTQFEPDGLSNYLKNNEIVYDKKKMNGRYQVGSGRIVTFTHDTPFIKDSLSHPDAENNNQIVNNDGVQLSEKYVSGVVGGVGGNDGNDGNGEVGDGERILPEYNSRGQKVSKFAETVARYPNISEMRISQRCNVAVGKAYSSDNV